MPAGQAAGLRKKKVANIGGVTRSDALPEVCRGLRRQGKASSFRLDERMWHEVGLGALLGAASADIGRPAGNADWHDGEATGDLYFGFVATGVALEFDRVLTLWHGGTGD